MKERTNDSASRAVRRRPPCPACDVDRLTRWLDDLAAQEGLFLQEDGFFLGFLTFTRGTPQPVRHRLEAVSKRSSWWSDDGGRPDGETLARHAQCGWEYVASYQNFAIYRALRPDAQEPERSVQEQAAVLKALRRRQREALCTACLWPLMAVLALLLSRAPVLAAVEAGSVRCLLLGLMLAGLVYDAVWEAVCLHRLRQRLRIGGPLARRRDWRKRAAPYHLKEAAQLALAVLWLVSLTGLWQADRVPLTEYAGDPPFATLADLAGPGASGYRSTMTGQKFNTFRVWSDWLAPCNVEWNEQAAVQRADGTTLNGGLWIEYHEAAAPWLARRLAAEYADGDARRKDAGGPLALPALPVEYAAAYTDLVGFPVVTLQNGGTVLHVTFGFHDRSELDDWVRLLAAQMG